MSYRLVPRVFGTTTWPQFREVNEMGLGELPSCAENEFLVVPYPHEESGTYCDTACPGDWLTTTSDGINWCFEPEPVPKYVPPDPSSVDNPDPGVPNPSFPPAAAAVEPVGVAKTSTPVWVFGLVAVVGVFSLAALMSD
jgi:hypothetical protein